MKYIRRGEEDGNLRNAVHVAPVWSGHCLSHDVIYSMFSYSMFCTLCAKEYVGETGITARKRFEEHLREAKAQAPETPWGEHSAEHHPQQAITSTPITNASILDTQSSLVNRRIPEAIFFRDRRPNVNRDRGCCDRLAHTTQFIIIFGVYVW